MRKKDYLVFGGGTKGYDLNIFGIRTNDMEANTFNDVIGVMYLFDSRWNCFLFPGSTDPGTYYRENPMNVNGTALLKPGQYRGMLKLGKHSGYDAFQQNAPVKVYRDADRDNVLEVDEDNVEEGMFGINLHRANASQGSTQVDKWSAGCQVLQDPVQFDFLYHLGEKSADRFGNSFTYTLLLEDDF